MEDVKTRLVNALKKLDTVMVTTKAENGTLRARPMAVADVDVDGVMWFVTSKESEKTHEILHDARAVISAQEKGLYVSLSGTLEVVVDRKRVHDLWKGVWKAWFPEGKDDPSIVLIRLRPEIGEYWDQTGTKGLQYLFEAAKALLDGKRVDDQDPRHHAKVPM
jgi:general stress protein 26